MQKTIILSILTLLITSCFKPDKFDEVAWRKQIAAADTSTLHKNNFDGEKYFAPWLKMEKKGLFTMIKWGLTQKADYPIKDDEYLPQVVPLTTDSIQKFGDDDFFVWLGHYSYLFRIDGKYLLVDPHLGKRAFLPKRLVAVPLQMEALSSISDTFLTLITHNHYDHLNIETLENLPDATKFIVPNGVKELLPEKFTAQTKECNWWQVYKISDSLEIISLPAQHWSNRLNQGAYKSLWCGYLIITPKYKIYISGDTGYFFGFKKFHEKFGAIDYAFMSVGPSDPRWLMHYQHVNLDETVEAFSDLGAQHLIPGHWGTFDLGDDPPGLTGKILKDRIKAGELDSNKILLPLIGKLYKID